MKDSGSSAASPGSRKTGLDRVTEGSGAYVPNKGRAGGRFDYEKKIKKDVLQSWWRV